MDAELAIQLLFLNQHDAEFEYYVNHAAIDVHKMKNLIKSMRIWQQLCIFHTDSSVA